jgi:hypothetical protein
LGCEACGFSNDCDIRKQFLEVEEHYKKGNIRKLRRISNLIELHEQYIVEMRRDVNHKLVELLRNRKKSRN